MQPRLSILLAVIALTTGGVAGATPIQYSGAVTTYTVAQTGIYSLFAEGAGGGTSRGGQNFTGGAGETIAGNLFLNAGTILSIAVGGSGASGLSVGGSGGGGTFIYVGSIPYLIAGGGGGAGYFDAGINATSSSSGGGAGGAAGAPNATPSGANGGGGAGFFSAGGNGAAVGIGNGYAGTGGSTAPSFAGGHSAGGAGNGGFGGGGGSGDNGGGGGGGYSGGNGGSGVRGSTSGVGGGSFAMSDFTDLIYTSAANPGGNGLVDIEFLAAAQPAGTVPEPASLALGAIGMLAAIRTRRRHRSS